MLVKHNYSTRSNKDIFLWSGGSRIGEYNVEYKDDKIYFSATKDTNNPALLGYPNARYAGKYCDLDIKNIGENNLLIKEYYEKNEVKYNLIVKPGETFNISNLEHENRRVIWIELENAEEAKNKNGIQIVKYMITDDDFSDVYLPNINTLPEDKQPLLPPEGNYKEIQAL